MTNASASRYTRSVFRLSVTAMFIALTAITVFLLPNLTINLFGEAGISVGFSGIFTAFPAFLFGPLYGGVASACSDIIGFLYAPTGPYNPCFTIVAFLGGFVKGLLWMILRKRTFTKSGGVIILAVLLCLGSFGVWSHMSLKNDGFSSSLIVSQEELPHRGEFDEENLSPMTHLAVQLATYNKDIISIKKATDAAEITIPTKLQTADYTHTVTRIRKNAFADCTSLTALYVPASITKLEYETGAGGEIDATAAHSFSGLPSGCVIYTPAGSTTAKFCKDAGIAYVEFDVESVTLTAAYDNLKVDGFTLQNSDTFRKYLTGYVIVMTIGMEAVAAGGLLLLLLEWGLSMWRGEKKSKSEGFVRIFLAITISGVMVTTINTQILLWFTASYAGRAFWLLWVPRLLEELVVCMLQAYLISVLYNVFERQIKPRISYFAEDELPS